MKKLALVSLLAAAAWAQPTVAPTGEPVGIARGENYSGYNVRQSFELGARFRSVGGDLGTYKATVNYGNGLRLLGSNLSVQSQEGHGAKFDQIQLNTQGLGNDPYQNASLRVEKNRIYRYDLSWRSNAYYNPGLRSDHGQHFADTVRNYQDHDLTLLPQSAIKFFLGYSQNKQTGPGITSALLLDTRGDQYPLFADIRRQQREYRAGFEVGVSGWRLNVMHGWVNFKEDTPIRLGSASQGYNEADATQLDSYRRSEPYHGNSPYWRVILMKESRWWAANGRFTYVKGQRGFIQDSTGFGTDRFGNNLTQQVFTAGNAQRPAATGSFNFSVFPSTKLTVTNQTALSHIRMSGSSVFTQLNNGSPTRPFVPFEFLGIRTISNSTDADYRPLRWLGVRLGYQYSTRRIRSLQSINTATATALAEQENGLHTSILGIRLRPTKSLTMNFDGEVGRADQPFYPVSGRNFQAFRGRAEYRKGDFRFAGYMRTDYNVNSGSLYSFASRNRQYGVDGTWTISRTFFIDAAYAKLHLDTLGALSYFARVGNANRFIQDDRSYYVSNLHTANLSTHFTVRNRVDVTLGLSHIQDTGDGRASILGNAGYTSLATFQSVQTFPMRFTSPQGKLSVRINDNLRWNAGYQNYGYGEQFSTAQGFRAHTGYTSITWAF